MSVKLISLTQDAEQQILFCARVSSDQSNDTVGLLSYLIRNKHWSPFEMAHAVMEVETSRAIAAQILRHRSFSFQEFSQRYASASESIAYRARRQGVTNRQSSTDDLSEDAIDWFYQAQEQVHDLSFELYDQAIALDIAKEQARFLLPLSTKTKLYISGSIRSWIHYFDLRCDEHTQEEHQKLALRMREILSHGLPNISKALRWYD